MPYRIRLAFLNTWLCWCKRYVDRYKRFDSGVEAIFITWNSKQACISLLIWPRTNPVEQWGKFLTSAKDQTTSLAFSYSCCPHFRQQSVQQTFKPQSRRSNDGNRTRLEDNKRGGKSKRKSFDSFFPCFINATQCRLKESCRERLNPSSQLPLSCRRKTL